MNDCAAMEQGDPGMIPCRDPSARSAAGRFVIGPSSCFPGSSGCLWTTNQGPSTPANTPTRSKKTAPPLDTSSECTWAVSTKQYLPTMAITTPPLPPPPAPEYTVKHLEWELSSLGSPPPRVLFICCTFVQLAGRKREKKSSKAGMGQLSLFFSSLSTHLPSL